MAEKALAVRSQLISYGLHFCRINFYRQWNYLGMVDILSICIMSYYFYSKQMLMIYANKILFSCYSQKDRDAHECKLHWPQKNSAHLQVRAYILKSAEYSTKWKKKDVVSSWYSLRILIVVIVDFFRYSLIIHLIPKKLLKSYIFYDLFYY
jgi:hypothetical protein